MGKIVKRVFITLAILIGLFLLAAVLVPVLFKDKILAIVKKEMNNNLNASADFKDVNLSLFKHFPNLSVGIEEVSVVGVATFSSDTLIAAKSIDISLDFMKAIGGTYDILNIGLVDPRIHAIVHKNGEANWNITKPDSSAKSSGAAQPFAMKLRKYSIEDAFIEYNDQVGKMYVMIEHLTHSGSGDFTSDAFTLSTKTTAEAVTFAMGGIPYLNRVKASADLDLGIDNKAAKYTFNTEKIQINGLKLSTKGFVQIPDTTKMLMDIVFSTPSNDFKDILSLVPGIYQNNFKDIKTTGKAKISGMVKGTYTSKQLPAFAVDMNITDGSFQYPDLPQKVSNIQLKLNVTNPDGVMDHTVVNLEKGHIEFGGDPFDFRLLLKTPLSNQWIDAAMKGKVDLTQMQKFVKLDAGTKLTGVIAADVSVKGSVAAAQKQKFDELYAAGTIAITNLAYASKDYPTGVDVTNLLLTFNPKNVTMSGLKGQYLGTHFTGDGSIDNLLGYSLHHEALKGSMHFAADQLDVNKFMGPPTPQPDPKTQAPMTVFVVPDNLDIMVKAEVGTVLYDQLKLTDVQGAMLIRNEVIALQNINCKGLDGTIKMNGFYGTATDKKSPDIQFDYGVDNIDVQKTYTSVGMVQKMMPAGKYISGKMNSHLSVAGKLGSNMQPVMNSLTGKGDLQMLSGLISNFPVTDQIADKLNMPKLKSFPVKDMKMSFTFENGRVTVQPYKFKIDQAEIEVAGSHGFDQTIQYGVNIGAPTAMMGSQGTSLVNNMLAQANTKGLALKLGDKVNLALKITGTVTAPKVETNLKNLAGDAVDDVKKQVADLVKHKADSVKAVVKDTVKAIKTQVVAAAKDELKKQFLGGGDSTKKTNTTDAVKDAAEKAKKGLKGLFGK